MVAIVTRAGKGSPLTNAEVDANFVNLNNGKLETSNNLSDLADAATARTNLGLGSLATLNSITSLMVTGALGYTPVNKAGDSMTGALSIQGNTGSSSGVLVYNTSTADGRAVVEFRNERSIAQRFSAGIDPDGGNNKAFAIRDLTASANRFWVSTLGNVNVGATLVNNAAININKTATGSSTISGFGNEQSVQSDVSTYRGYNTAIATQATSFTLSSITHYRAAQGTFGAGSSVSNQTGFIADSTLIGAGTNIGFRGAIASATNRWNLYMDGSAQNFLSGNVLIGNNALSGGKVVIGGSLTGQTVMSAVRAEMTVMSDVTTGARGYQTLFNTQATAFTLPDIIHYRAVQGTIGAGSTVTSQNGFVADSTLVGAGTNIGFRGAIPAGANRWNLYMDGTAQNFIGGNLILDGALGIGAVGSPDFGITGQVLTSAGPGADPVWATPTGGVTSFNTRTGAVTLSSSDVTTALGFTPFSAAGGTITTTNSTASIIVSDTGTSGGNIRLTGNGGTTPSKTIRAFNGNFEIVNSGYTAAIITVSDAGALTAANNITAYSDERLKTNWRDLSDDFIEALAQVKHGIYDRTDMISTQVGVSAQSLEGVLANAIEKSANGILSVAYGNAAMVSAVQLAKRVVLLQERLDRIEQKVGA